MMSDEETLAKFLSGLADIAAAIRELADVVDVAGNNLDDTVDAAGSNIGGHDVAAAIRELIDVVREAHG